MTDSAATTSRSVRDPLSYYARTGLWAMPVFALLLGVGTLDHQPPPQTQIDDWSRFVTTDLFLYKHLIASIGGAVFGAFGAIAFGVVLMQRGSVRLGLWGLLTGVPAQVLTSSIIGVSAYTHPRSDGSTLPATVTWLRVSITTPPKALRWWWWR